VDLTYNRGQVWTNPDYPQYQYTVPDNVVVQNVPESFLLDGTFVEQTVTDYQFQFEQFTKWHHCGLFGCSSGSKDLKEYYHYYYGENRSMALSMKYISWYSLTVPPLPPPQPHPMLALAIQHLPQIYNASAANKQIYMDFIHTFGTSWITDAVLGGMIVQKAWYHSCLAKTYSLYWLQQQSSWGFLGIIGNGHGKTINDTRVTAVYEKDQISISEMVGGDQVHYQPSQWLDWVPTIKLQPAPVQYSARPITDFITDPVKQQSMNEAVTDYITYVGQLAQQEIAAIAKNNTNRAIPKGC